MIRGLKIPFFLVRRYFTHGSKWTFLFIVLLMAIAYINLIFTTAFFYGIIEAVNNQVIDTHMGHIYVLPPEGTEYIENKTEMIRSIKSDKAVTGASAHLLVPGRISYKKIAGIWEVIAVDPEMEKTVTNISRKMMSGSYLDKNDTDKIIIGRQVAGGENVEMNAVSFRGARVGEKVTLNAGGFQKEFTIKGIFYTKFLDTDKRAFISRRAVDEIAPFISNWASSIIVRIDKTGEEKTVISRFKDRKIKAKFFSWKEVAGYLEPVTKSFVHINALLTMVGMMIAAITIFIVIYIDITSKRQQIGVLRAIGIRPSLIRVTSILQSLGYSISGIAIGLLVMIFGIAPWLKSHPFKMPIGDSILIIDYHDMLFRAELLVAVAIVSGFIPAFIITREKILDAIFNR